MESSLITSFFKPLRPPPTSHTPSEAVPTPPHTSKTRPIRTGRKSHKKKKSKVKGHLTLSSMGANDDHVCLESCDSEGVFSDGVECVEASNGVECVAVTDCVVVGDGVECVEVGGGVEVGDGVVVGDGVECVKVSDDEGLTCCVSPPIRPMASYGHMGLVHVRQCDPTDELWSLRSHVANDVTSYQVATPTSSYRELCDWSLGRKMVHDLPVSVCGCV